MRKKWVMVAGAACAACLALPTMAVSQNSSADSGEDVSAPDPEAAARLAAVERHVDAYKSGNLDRFVATFTPDAQVYGNGMVATGHKEIRNLYRLNFASGAPRIRVESIEYTDQFVFIMVAYLMNNGE